MKGSNIYRVWGNIKSRCYNKNNPGYVWYGARDIKVCDEWVNDFHIFYDYVSELPDYGEDGFTLDRINNDGNYGPGNVRWADKHTQNANQGRQKNNTTGFAGVTKYPRDERYMSYIIFEGTRKHIGLADSILEAVDLRNNFIIKNGLWEYPIQATPDYLLN